MEITNGTAAAAAKTDHQTQGASDAYGKLGFEDFIKLLITELTNQDPMEPVSNAELLNQIGQIREIASTDKLTTTLEAVMMGQTLATAGNVVDKVVDGMTDAGYRLCGNVVSVAIEEGRALLQVQDAAGDIHSVDLRNVSNIYPEGTSLPTPGYLAHYGESAQPETGEEAPNSRSDDPLDGTSPPTDEESSNTAETEYPKSGADDSETLTEGSMPTAA